MKQLLIFALLAITYTNAQVSLEVGTDPKIFILGTDNVYTKHDSVENFYVQLEALDRSNNVYVALGYQWVNLQQWYQAGYMNFGYKFDLFGNEKLRVIPNFEFGGIYRQRYPVDELDNRKIPVSVYTALNIPVRYQVSERIWVQGKGQLQHATDIEGRLFRYAGFVSVVIQILK